MKRLVLFLSAILSAQQSIDAPPLAHVLNADGLLTPIFGLAGNFVAGRSSQFLLAYSNDGDIEWRLEPGRLSATRGGRTAVFATTASRAIFRGDAAVLPESGEILRLDGESFVRTSEEPAKLVAGRSIRWEDGMLRITQPNGAVEELPCPVEPDELTAAASDWVHVTVDGRAHLLRLTAGRAALFVLPLRRRE